MNENDVLFAAVISVSAATAAIKITTAVLSHRRAQRAATIKADKERANAA
jgi:hypothetical protein